MEIKKIAFVIDEKSDGLRLDQALANVFPDISRARFQDAIKDASILLNHKEKKPSDRVYSGDKVSGCLRLQTETYASAQAIDLDVIYVDEDMIVVNKPAGMVVHPAAGNPDGTLLNALLYHFPENALLPRAGIIHRLDKDTSGILLVAHSIKAHHYLSKQLQDRTMGREYLGLVLGTFSGGGTIDAPIARHHKDRTRMSVCQGGREAITHYRIEERFTDMTLLRLHLETGRTHQIRVHLAHILHPLIGDPVYSGRKRLPKGVEDSLRENIMCFKRQALHAERLKLLHPKDGRPLSFSCELAGDMFNLLQKIRQCERK